MRKLLLTCALSLVLTSQVAGAPLQDCAYSPLQALVRDARDAEQIKTLISKNVNLDETPRCGGTLMQLAVRRGNIDVLAALLQQDLKRANQIVSLDEFPIPGAPKKVPLILFAAYYAPNEQVVQLLQQARANIAQTDDMGRNVLWYMDRNPVLRKTALFDQLNLDLLESLSSEGADTILDAQNLQSSATPNVDLTKSDDLNSNASASAPVLNIQPKESKLVEHERTQFRK